MPKIHDDAPAFGLCLDRVTAGAERLQVGGIEEQCGFAPVWNDVIDVNRRRDLVEAPATLTGVRLDSSTTFTRRLLNNVGVTFPAARPWETDSLGNGFIGLIDKTLF